ncbi:MAG: hypothetical protein DI636_00030 [Pelagerythrobacter marensis]|nr:MAG: hypothetical protein DI636_00030 [Pelagerythrobacter marensis]PZU17621.1 MAG: hypothetical protein DI591_02190 [Citromicrobium sp.]
MRALVHLGARLMCNCRGTAMIETALVAPLLLTLGLGAFEVGTMVTRYQELESAAAESELIALTFADGGEESLPKMKAIIGASLGIPAATLDHKVRLSKSYRCGVSETLVAAATACPEDVLVSELVKIELRDTYTPTWTHFGVGGPVNFAIDRSVQVN